MPASARQRSAAAGEAETFTPRASSTSALPQRLETDRLPCFATGTPQAATTMAAADEMLNVPDRSPPVPHVSNTSHPCVSNRTACRRIVSARPTISSGRSPFIARATRNAAVTAGVAPPDMISDIASAASAVVRSSRAVSFWRMAVNISEVQEAAQHTVPLAGQHGLGVELHPVNRAGAMAQSHDDPLLARAGRDFELLGQPLFRDDQGVIPAGGERFTDAAEDTTAIVLDDRRLAVHRDRRTHHAAAEGCPNRLVPETHPEHGDFVAQPANHVEGEPRMFRPS